MRAAVDYTPRLGMALRDLLWPRVCLACGQRAADGVMCGACLDRSVRIQDAGRKRASPNMLPPIAVWRFDRDAPVRRVLHRLKYGNCPWIGRELGLWITASEARLAAREWDAVVPVPLHYKRILERGYNQAEWIARGVAQMLGLEVIPRGLSRIRNTATQTSLAKDRRLENVAGAFVAAEVEQINGSAVILVDDTMTTGATLEAASRALVAAGATLVQPLAVARAALYLEVEQPASGSVIDSQEQAISHVISFDGNDLRGRPA